MCIEYVVVFVSLTMMIVAAHASSYDVERIAASASDVSDSCYGWLADIQCCAPNDVIRVDAMQAAYYPSNVVSISLFVWYDVRWHRRFV